MDPERSAPVRSRALTFDYWDTLYEGAVLPERMKVRQAALAAMLSSFGHSVAADELDALYRASGEEADRWWREEHRGYTADERVRWMLERLSIRRPDDCEHVARACQAVDDALLTYPPPLLRGAAEALRRLAPSYRLGIISDTGFASGRAQDALLERDGLRSMFEATVYSVDVRFAKPRAEPFRAAIEAMELPPGEIIHIGDNERTDVRGALAMGMRAIRVDFVRQGGPSAAEKVVTTFDELLAYLG